MNVFAKDFPGAITYLQKNPDQVEFVLKKFTLSYRSAETSQVIENTEKLCPAGAEVLCKRISVILEGVH